VGVTVPPLIAAKISMYISNFDLLIDIMALNLF
jgi:hypothetical protein